MTPLLRSGKSPLNRVSNIHEMINARCHGVGLSRPILSLSRASMEITMEINRIKTLVPETRFIAIPLTEAVASKDFYEGQLIMDGRIGTGHWRLSTTIKLPDRRFTESRDKINDGIKVYLFFATLCASEIREQRASYVRGTTALFEYVRFATFGYARFAYVYCANNLNTRRCVTLPSYSPTSSSPVFFSSSCLYIMKQLRRGRAAIVHRWIQETCESRGTIVVNSGHKFRHLTDARYANEETKARKKERRKRKGKNPHARRCTTCDAKGAILASKSECLAKNVRVDRGHGVPICQTSHSSTRATAVSRSCSVGSFIDDEKSTSDQKKKKKRPGCASILYVCFRAGD